MALTNYTPTPYPQLPDAQPQYFTNEFRKISAAIGSAEAAIASDESDITTINSEITTINGDITTINGDITTINGDITTINGDITTINSTLSAIESAWAAYTPTVTAQVGTITSYTASGRYKQIGKTVTFTVTISVTSVGTATDALLCTFPVTALTAQLAVFCGRENSLSGFMIQGSVASSTTSAFFFYNNTSVFGTGSGSVYLLSGTYEAA